MRKCIYDDKEMIFHEFYVLYDVIGESPMVGGHSAGQISSHMAVLEDENGQIFHISSQCIRFIKETALKNRSSRHKASNSFCSNASDISINMTPQPSANLTSPVINIQSHFNFDEKALLEENIIEELKQIAKTDTERMKSNGSI